MDKFWIGWLTGYIFCVIICIILLNFILIPKIEKRVMYDTAKEIRRYVFDTYNNPGMPDAWTQGRTAEAIEVSNWIDTRFGPF